jgi:hypothetical protein
VVVSAELTRAAMVESSEEGEEASGAEAEAGGDGASSDAGAED